MKVTIAIAMYNVAEYIQECVESALSQDFDDFEVLVCDDCSTDGSADIVRKGTADAIKMGKLRIITRSENMGVACSRNTAIREANGDYIFFMDGDDCIPQNAISCLYDEMQRSSADFVIGNFVRWNGQHGDDGVYSQHYYFNPGVVESDLAMASWLQVNRTDYFPVGLWGKLYRRDWLLINKIACNPHHRLVEDIFFSFQVSLEAKRIATVKDVVYLWRVREGSAVLRSVSESYARQYLNVYDACLTKLSEYTARHPNRIIPQEMYSILTNRYLGDLCLKRIVRSDNMSAKAKKDYVNHIASITQIGVKASSLPWRRRMAYYAMATRWRFPLIKLLVKLSS